MRSELLFRDFDVADSPGLDTFDPRLGDVMVAVQNSDFAQAADLAEALLNENECDIRLAGYLLFDDYASYGSSALPQMFAALNHLFENNWDAFGPVKNKEKQALAAVNWLVNTLAKLFDKAMTDAGERWNELVDGLTFESAAEMNAAYQAFNGLFENRVGELAAKNLNARSNLGRILARFSELHEQVSEPEPEPEPEVVDTQIAGDGQAPQQGGQLAGEAVAGSVHLALLMKKMSALGELAAKGRHDLAAIIVADVQDTLANFDPLLYFPDVFADYNKVLAENVDMIFEHLEMRGTPRWDAFEAYYKSDLDGFKDQ